MDWREIQDIEELSRCVSDWRVVKITQEVYEIGHFDIFDLVRINECDAEIGEKVLAVLLEWACYGQNVLGIELGRKYISFIPNEWLSQHMIHAVQNYFEYQDYWNYRRLLELAEIEVPELISELIEINKDSTDQDILEMVEDYSYQRKDI